MGKYKIAYANIKNAGDLFNEALMDYFGKEFVKTDIIDASLVMLGGQLSTLLLSSHLKMRLMQRVRCCMCDVNAPLHVWGTGFLVGDVQGQYLRKNLRIHALRGALTKAKLAKDLMYTPDTVSGSATSGLPQAGLVTGSPVLADPGLLACEFLHVSVDKEHKIGFIPHFRELDMPVVKEIIDRNPGLFFIDITQPYQKVFREIRSCETILSSSLHGLVLSDSLGVPIMHIVLSDRIKGSGFKFRDYYSAFGLEDTPYAVNGAVIPSEREIFDSYRIDSRSVDAKIQGLIDSFPMNI